MAQSPAPQQQGSTPPAPSQQQQSQTPGNSQQQGQPLFRDWADI